MVIFSIFLWDKTVKLCSVMGIINSNIPTAHGFCPLILLIFFEYTCYIGSRFEFNIFSDLGETLRKKFKRLFFIEFSILILIN